jgi:hypothetical protein
MNARTATRIVPQRISCEANPCMECPGTPCRGLEWHVFNTL